MKKIKLCTLMMSAALLMFFTNLTAQVTIGNAQAPVTGSLLQMKENETTGGSANANRGLGMPRVKLTDLNNLYPMFEANSGNYKIDETPYVKADEDAKHIGLWVYNTTKEETISSRICPGLHIWDGTHWQPLIAYPTFVDRTKGSQIKPDLVDSRNGGAEVKTYHNAGFDANEGGNRYACDAKDFPVYIDAGVWMTQDLATQYTPDGFPIKPKSAAPANDIATPYYDKYNPNSVSGLGHLYTWAAATVQPGGNVGRGGATGLDITIDELNVDVRVQGICPNGWHLPNTKEWDLLFRAMKAEPNKFALPGSNLTAADVNYALMSPTNVDGTPTSGKSKPSNQGGFDLHFSGYFDINYTAMGIPQEYALRALIWSSSTFPGSSAYYFNTYPNPNSYQGITAHHRKYLCSVRCKKD